MLRGDDPHQKKKERERQTDREEHTDAKEGGKHTHTHARPKKPHTYDGGTTIKGKESKD